MSKRKATTMEPDAGGVAVAEPEAIEARAPTPEPQASFDAHVEDVAVELLLPTPDNTRVFREDEAFARLVDSVRRHGVLENLLARRHPEISGHYDLRAGHRRLEAAKRAGLATVPVKVLELDDREAMEITIVENFHREDLTPFEESASLQKLVELGWSIESIGERLSSCCRQDEFLARMEARSC